MNHANRGHYLENMASSFIIDVFLRSFTNIRLKKGNVKNIDRFFLETYIKRQYFYQITFVWHNQ